LPLFFVNRASVPFPLSRFICRKKMWQTEQFKNVHLTAVSFSGPLAYSVKRPNNVDAMTQPLADIFCGTDHVIARTTEATGGEVLKQPYPYMAALGC
jgi:hypothetical protein